MNSAQASSRMPRRKLGAEGPEISVIGVGAWAMGGTWGTNPPDDQMIASMRSAFDAGMNWIDTAEVYGNSEELVGRAVKGRDDVMVFTKVAPAPGGSGLDAAGIRAGAERSLKRLRRDVIDLYQVHQPPPRELWQETWEAMARLVEDGLVRYVGVSNFDRALIQDCERIRHVDSLQPQFSMLYREGRHDLFPFCKANGTGVICYGPLSFGLLTGAVSAATRFADDDWRGGVLRIPAPFYDELFAPGVLKKHLALVDALRSVADRLGATLAQLALAWVLHQDGVTGVTTGLRRAEHVVENVEAAFLHLTVEDLADIENILLGTHGAATRLQP